MTKTLNFRNHGFLLTAKGWTLSPAYDMTPTPMSIKICLSHQLPIEQTLMFYLIPAKIICLT